MLDRYALPAMRHVFSDDHKLALWCRVETVVVEVQAELGAIPDWVVAPIKAAAAPTPTQVAQVEAHTRHDVIAFLTAWADNTTPREAAAYVHFGMTSSDLVDTALALQLIEASDILLNRADALVDTLKQHALEHRATVRVGRTHGVHGEPDVWGHRVADFAFAAARSRDRLRRARNSVAVAKISGAVGTYSSVDPMVEVEAARRLALRPADAATQVVMRDNLSEWINALAILATVCEAIALEVRHGQRTEVRELAESFGAGQKGSSAMPHKRNPVGAERICGLARVVRAQMVPVLEGVPLWHERDISHSSVERIAIPTAAILTDYLLQATADLIAGLVVDTARMAANLDQTLGLTYSSAVLLALITDGMSREDAHRLVQAAATVTWRDGVPFRQSLREQAATVGRALPEERLDRVCRPEHYLSNVDTIFDRLASLS